MMKRNAAQQALPRNSLIWLLVAQVLVILPLLAHVPLWISAMWLGCAIWRIQVFRTRLSFPRALVKLLLMLSAAGAVYLSRGSIIGLDAAVALLVTAFILKLVELKSRRDALVLIYLGFFTLVTAFLFNDSLLAAVYGLLPATTLLAAMVGLHQGRLNDKPKQTFRIAAGLLAQAIPVAILLFLFFPRFDPLWVLPAPKDKGVTGISDHMTPGDIAELSRSAELVFRASFQEEVPKQNELYWRALTLPHFDGRTWRAPSSAMDSFVPDWQPRGAFLDYSVVMQPSSNPWLYSLMVSEVEQADIRMMADFRVQHRAPVWRTFLYQARAWPDAIVEPVLSRERWRQYVQLPREGNTEARAWAHELRKQYTQDNELVNAILRYFNREPYYYTLSPPKLGANSVDEFLFNTRTGFCEHYAGAMTFVLRAAGIPARVVTGYQGGEINHDAKFVQVRQYDAHAWVEYWEQGVGWRRVDPTFQVAPDRIDYGLEQALAGSDEQIDAGLLSALSYQHIGFINKLRIRWDELNYNWQLYVLGYQVERQQNWLRQLFGALSWKWIGLGLVISIACLIGLIGLFLLKPWQAKRTFEAQILSRFDRLMQRQQHFRAKTEGLRAFQSRIEGSLNAEQKLALKRFVELFEVHEYAGQKVDKTRLLQELTALQHAFKKR